MYEFLIWTALLGVVWFIAYVSQPALRKKIWWSSWIAFPFGIGELYFIPSYWTPQTLFDLGMRYRIDIESFALMFFMGGIAAFVYEGFFKQRVPAMQKICHPLCRCYVPLIATLIAFIVFTRAFPAWNIIYPSSIACLFGGATAMLIYPGLRKHVLFGGILFALLYWISLGLIDLAFTGWIASTWNMAALSSITLFRVPVEEILFGFSLGTLWAPLFEEVCSNFHVTKTKKDIKTH